MWRVLYLLLAVFILSCATTSRLPIHKVVDSTTVRTKVVLMEREGIDPAYQKAAVREFEAYLLKEPVTHTLKTAFGGEKVDLILITRKEVQRIKSITPEEIKKIGEESDLQVLIVLEPLKINYSEGSVKRGNEFCITRQAEALISAKVMGIREGKVIIAGVYNGKVKKRQCSKGAARTDKLPEKDKIVVKALKKAAMKFSKEFWNNL